MAGTVRWRLHLRSPRSRVFDVLTTAEGRAAFWAESAVEIDGAIHFRFPDGQRYEAAILERVEHRRLRIEYLGRSIVTFDLEHDGQGGTELALSDEGVPDEDITEVTAGWVSVLMALKAAIDFGVDLRTHDPKRTWAAGYVEN